uniref:Unannotated protein n=1 Tax=freshwater metagenome TaxID=449393 RepID=A0A6J7Q7S0_9ZZZZ
MSANWTTRLPSPLNCDETSGAFETARCPGSTTSVMENTDLKSGSSQQGNARRQSVACIWVAATTRSLPDSSV